MSLFSCLSPLSVKFLGFLLLLWKQTPSILPRKPGDVSLETMPRDTSHMLLRNHCMMVLKAQPFVATSLSTRCPTSSITKRAAGRGHPLHYKEVKVFGNINGITLALYQHVSCSDGTWTYSWWPLCISLSILLTSCTVRWCLKVACSMIWQPFIKQKTEETKPCILVCLYLLRWQCGGDLLYPLTSQACCTLYMLNIYI